MEGWIKLHRCLLNNPVVMKDSDHIAVWVYLLLEATHKDIQKLFKGEKITLKPGQLITGRIVISDTLKISESKVRRILNEFESDHQIDRQRSNKNSLITILNWELYQSADQQDDQQVTNKRPTSDQQVTTLQEYKNNKNNNNMCVPGEKSPSYDEDFETLWKSYPKERRKEKLDAKAKFLAYVTTGATYKRKKYKFTVDEIYEGFNWYINNTKEEPGDEPYKYWKLFNTLMYNIPEYIERAREENDK